MTLPCNLFTDLRRQLPDELFMTLLEATYVRIERIVSDVRHAPREVQEIAFKKGLIPIIPADQQQR